MIRLLLCMLITCASLSAKIQPGLPLTKQVRGTWIQTVYAHKKKTKLVKAKFSHCPKGICGREFFSYNKYGILVKHVVDNGSSRNKGDLKGVTKRSTTKISLQKKMPFFGLPSKIKKYSYDRKKKKDVLRKKTVHRYLKSGLPKRTSIYNARKKLDSIITYRHEEEVVRPPVPKKGPKLAPTSSVEKRAIKLILTPDELEKIDQERNAHPLQTVQRRLDAIYLTGCGKKRGEVAKILGCSAASVRNWIAIYKRDGIAGLTKTPSKKSNT